MSKRDKKISKKLTKIIYFDESSVTDYIQIIEGGSLTKTTELLSDATADANTSIGAEASIGISGLFKSLIGFGGKIQSEAKLDASIKSESLVKTILQNTILTDFLDIVGTEKSQVKVFDDLKIKVIKDSLSYIIMISPYMKMLKGDALNLNTDLDLSIDIVKMDESIKLAKGYFEFEGMENNASIILRFNIDSFKNNYKISDLLKMDLTIYAVSVGKTDRKSLSIVSEINAVTVDDEVVSNENPKYGDKDRENDGEKGDNSENFLTVYDVLLAGVAQDEQ